MENNEFLRNEEIEINLFIEMLYQKYGYDFRDYSKAHMKRRIKHRIEIEAELNTISDYTHKVLWDESFFRSVIPDFSINVTEMFRDPSFYQKIREEVVPLLKTYPFLKIWHAGCSSGEEVYSMAILLKEEELLHKTQIYATDFNDIILKKAKEGIYSSECLKTFNRNYKAAGGTKELSDYFSEAYGKIIFETELKERILFSNHNLVTDGIFGEMNMIICRNVLIYFERTLQNKVFRLFEDSLCRGGILGIGSKESLEYSEVFERFKTIDSREKIYKKL
ncbi:protein-glutamate O-methyltransferase CheR [Eubacteriaceae bacterium ES3]|nr:protein-glutamate O-methyltransferase CheR [Eubacteriaceae bacterium ES3]